jgi:hypothetical protein
MKCVRVRIAAVIGFFACFIASLDVHFGALFEGSKLIPCLRSLLQIVLGKLVTISANIKTELLG